MIATKAQEWARKRNYGKAQLMGMQSQLLTMRHENWLTKQEQYWLRKAYDIIEKTVYAYKENNQGSKEKYLDEESN